LDFSATFSLSPSPPVKTYKAGKCFVANTDFFGQIGLLLALQGPRESPLCWMRERTLWLIFGEPWLAAKCDGDCGSGRLFQSVHRGDVFHFSFAVFLL